MAHNIEKPSSPTAFFVSFGTQLAAAVHLQQPAVHKETDGPLALANALWAACGAGGCNHHGGIGLPGVIFEISFVWP